MNGMTPREVVGQFYELFSAGDVDGAWQCARTIWKSSIRDGSSARPRAFREYLETFRRAMPDARAIVENAVESGDTVAVEGRFTGTHTGPLATDDGDVEPTGAAVDLRFADISHVRHGKIVAYHTYYDQLGLLTQLGFDGSELMLPFERTTSSFGRLGSERDEIGKLVPRCCRPGGLRGSAFRVALGWSELECWWRWCRWWWWLQPARRP